MITVEKNIPIPSPAKKEPTKYPWKTMEVGDSFFVKGDAKSVRSQASYATKRYCRKFVTRQEKDGIRFWRTE